jgi:hypothetical protein
MQLMKACSLRNGGKLGIAAKKYEYCGLALTFREIKLKGNLSGGYFSFLDMGLQLLFLVFLQPSAEAEESYEV